MQAALAHLHNVTSSNKIENRQTFLEAKTR